MDESVIPGKIYLHHKGGKYLVVAVTEESTNERIGTLGVVYVSLTYGKFKHRDLQEFIEEVEWPDGIKRPRFILKN